MLYINNLTMKYGQSQVLNAMSLSAKAGEVTAVMGTNGVGKTSLLKAISGRHPYADGTITLDGKLINHLSPFKGRDRLCAPGARSLSFDDGGGKP